VAQGPTGWGSDPRLKLLRTLAFFLLGFLLVFAVIAERDITTTGLLCGALMVLLGFEGLMRWPGSPK
jgi:hypothetical protein